MSSIVVIGIEGEPILYASLTPEGNLFFEFEYYARNENERDYEFNHTVKPDQFSRIAERFRLNPDESVLKMVQQISDLGKGQELAIALTNKEIENELWTWLNTP